MPLAPPPPQSLHLESTTTHDRPSVGAAIGIGLAVSLIMSIVQTAWYAIGFRVFGDFVLPTDIDSSNVASRLALFQAPIAGGSGFLLHFLLGRRDRLREGLSGGAVWFGVALLYAATVRLTSLFDIGIAGSSSQGLVVFTLIGVGLGTLRGLTREWPAPLLIGAITAVTQLGFVLLLDVASAGSTGFAILMSIASGLVGTVLTALVLAHFAPAPFTYGGTNDHFAQAA